MTDPGDLAETPRYRFWMVGLLILALLMNAVVAALLIWTRADQSEYIRCAAKYDQAFAEAYEVRHQPLVDVDAAMDELVMSVANEDSREFERAVDRYIQLRTEQDRLRRENPLPPLPRALCGVPR